LALRHGPTIWRESKPEADVLMAGALGLGIGAMRWTEPVEETSKRSAEDPG